MKKQTVNTKKAPAAIGPYAQAIKVGDFVYTSGQISINPENGEVERGDVISQTRRVLDNLIAVLTEAGAALDTVIKTTVFLKSMGDFAAMNGVYSEYFSEQPPARSCVQISMLPKDVLVEIEAVAYQKGSE